MAGFFILAVILIIIVGSIVSYFESKEKDSKKNNSSNQSSNTARKFYCTGDTGTHSGTGRYSYEGEYSSYFGRNLKAEEVVFFTYDSGNSEVYEFEAINCSEK